MITPLDGGGGGLGDPGANELGRLLLGSRGFPAGTEGCSRPLVLLTFPLLLDLGYHT